MDCISLVLLKKINFGFNYIFYSTLSFYVEQFIGHAPFRKRFSSVALTTRFVITSLPAYSASIPLTPARPQTFGLTRWLPICLFQSLSREIATQFRKLRPSFAFILTSPEVACPRAYYSAGII